MPRHVKSQTPDLSQDKGRYMPKKKSGQSTDQVPRANRKTGKTEDSFWACGLCQEGLPLAQAVEHFKSHFDLRAWSAGEPKPR